MSPGGTPGLPQVLQALADLGLLLASDPRLPSVAGMVAGGPVRGSWWGHEKGRAIFAVMEALDQHPDVLSTRLVRGKVTFVHRRLWPALWAVATAPDAGRTRGLSDEAQALMAEVDRRGRVRATGAAATELEQRLLVRSRQVHTGSGAHARELVTWQAWAEEAGFQPGRMTATEGALALDEAVAGLEAAADGSARR